MTRGKESGRKKRAKTVRKTEEKGRAEAFKELEETGNGKKAP